MSPHAAQTWPIAAAMINVRAQRRDGTLVQDDAPDGWLRDMRKVRLAGFDHIDPTDSWLRVADLSPQRRAAFADAVAEAGLAMVSLSTARRSILDPETGVENLAYSHRVIDVAAELGIPLVSFGLMRGLTEAQAAALWFWTAPGPVDGDDPETWRRAVEGFRDLGTHAASVGVQISLEMYEDTLLGTAEGAARLVEDIRLDNVGLNPDLGNLVRLHRPIEHWQEMADRVLPHANYWHTKNYSRIEDATTGAVMAAPAPMESGTIDYRSLIEQAVAGGFRGAFCTEHYGGDGLSVSATNRDYIRRILATIPDLPTSQA